jgi:GNAT superfamily N-acetyltransferase
MDCPIILAGPADAEAIAALHIESWRDAYRGLVPDPYLDGPIVEERAAFWRARLAEPGDGRFTLKALTADSIGGFACTLRDAEPEWGPLLDNLHVKPALKGVGIGARLLRTSREWAARVAPGQTLHLWVIEGNTAARRFYDRQGGAETGRRVNEMVPGVVVTAVRYVWPPLAAPDSSV